VEVVAKTGSEAYVALVRRVLNEGEPTVPRGQHTFELMNVTVQVENLAAAHVLRTARRLSPKIMATEYMHLLGGISSLEQLDLASGGRFSQFADDGRLKGAYGPRIRHQLPRVVDLLRRDPDTRQAVLSIWTQNEHISPSKDVPCTVSVQFLLRNDKLHVRTSMRSNDVILGVPYDWFMMSRLGMSVASCLGVEPGSYTHTVGSMHLYDRDLGIANDVESVGVFTEPRFTVPPALTYDGPETDPRTRVKMLAVMARLVCLEPLVDGEWEFDHPGATWYGDHVPRIQDVAECVACHSVFKRTEMYEEDPDFCQLCG
jgi:thymidylate synthase